MTLSRRTFLARLTAAALAPVALARAVAAQRSVPVPPVPRYILGIDPGRTDEPDRYQVVRVRTMRHGRPPSQRRFRLDTQTWMWEDLGPV